LRSMLFLEARPNLSFRDFITDLQLSCYYPRKKHNPNSSEFETCTRLQRVQLLLRNVLRSQGKNSASKSVLNRFSSEVISMYYD
jgi:hypothetical protein